MEGVQLVNEFRVHRRDGQAAGIAAALCILNGATPAALDYAELKPALLEQKVFLG